MASVEKEREASAVRAAESIESAEAKAADAIARFEAKEKELWARDAQLEKRARDAVRDAKAHAERVAALTDEKAALAAELTGAKAAIRRTNRVKEESTRKLRDELEETKRALLHATSRRVGRPWASDSREGVARGLATAGEDAVPTDDDVQRMEDKLEKERGKRERAEAAAASLQSALALARKQSHADHERLSGECRTLRALASALELERDSLRVTLKGRADLAADLTARAQLDAGKIAGLDARRERAKPRAQTGEGRGGRLAARVAESERERGRDGALLKTAEATASRAAKEAEAARAEVESARAEAANAALAATAARHELEVATRARDVAVEDAARSKALVGAHERTIEELRREVRSHATRSEELSPELVEGELGRERKQSEELVNKQSEELAELRAKVRDAEEQTRKATDALVKTEAWARAAEKALAAEKASSPKAKGAPASASAKAAVEGSVVAGSNPVSAAVSPLRPLDANAGDGGGSKGRKTARETARETTRSPRPRPPPSRTSPSSCRATRRRRRARRASPPRKRPARVGTSVEETTRIDGRFLDRFRRPPPTRRRNRRRASRTSPGAGLAPKGARLDRHETAPGRVEARQTRAEAVRGFGGDPGVIRDGSAFVRRVSGADVVGRRGRFARGRRLRVDRFFNRFDRFKP